ncbi:hypothetical protein OGAPHI_004145 [Ogataea philodendri]|uniref:Uncharacterized protein n=1 Tax=Ogataea philodendri TaxID=1378263 RepID=A0A9P8T4P9_9ASCO|nr:uncharacterized protein OGAPHI_004145 [Ogataea philodendri]KAH3665956.1 hypothetical protein OGAPHI_004145 [Ogataea philodendri]
MSNSELELSKSFHKRSRLNISNGTTKFNDTDIWLHSRRINRDSSNSLDPVLNGVGDVWNNLDSLTQRDTQVTLIISQIQIDFSTIIQNETLTMFQRRHSSCINVKVRVNLDGSDS